MSKENETKEEKRRRKALHRISIPLLSTPPSIQTQITVICVRFGNRYGREYVERLRNMVSRHMTVPYEFVCLTDDHTIISGVRNIVQPNARYVKEWWHKVHLFDPNLPLTGRILYFDLDVVIHNNIDKLISISDIEFMGIHDFNRKFYAAWLNLNSSVMAWTYGTQNHIWDRFKANPKEAMRLQGDQDWIWKTSKDRIKFWPKDWIQSYKWEIRTREELIVLDGKRQFKTIQNTVSLPSECCVTVFHGDPKPQDVKDQFVVDNWQ